MNVLIFGGSFNPVHNGHLNLLHSMLDSPRIGIEKTIIMPAYVSPFKTGSSEYAAPADRLEMCRLAFGDIPGTEISDYELRKGGVSYTVETLRYLCDIFPDDNFFLALGGDMIKSFPTWNNYKEIMSMCTIAAAARCDSEKEEIVTAAKKLSEFGRVEAVESEPFEISSTGIREMIAEGIDVSGVLPHGVAEYILSKGIYTAVKK